MSIEITEALWLDRNGELSIAELAEFSGLSVAELGQLAEYEVLTPAGGAEGGSMFTGQCLITARIAYRLRNDFELDAAGLALVLRLLERIGELQAQVRGLEAQLPRRQHQA